MHELYELKEKLLSELAGYSENGKFSEDDAENIKNLSGAVDHLCNIIMDFEDEYSNEYREGGRGGGSNRASRQGGSSNARGNGRRNPRRAYRERYSRDEAVDEMADVIRDGMNSMPDELRKDAQRLLNKLESM